jgi:hypothetical protein
MVVHGGIELSAIAEARVDYLKPTTSDSGDGLPLPYRAGLDDTQLLDRHR